MHNISIMLGVVAFSALPFLTTGLHANRIDNEAGSHQRYKQRDSTPYKNLANMLKTAQKKASAARVGEVSKKSKSHSGNLKNSGKVRADTNRRSLKSASRNKATSGSLSARYGSGSKKLAHRLSKKAGKAGSHKRGYSAKNSSKGESLKNSLKRKSARTAAK